MEHIKPYPLSYAAYCQYKNDKNFNDLLIALGLPTEYIEKFRAAKNEKFYRGEKLTFEKDHKPLKNTFSKLYNEEKEGVKLAFNKTFLDRLNKFSNKDGISEEEKKQYNSMLFLVWSSLFTRFTSSKALGAEFDSLHSLRVLAWVFLKHAYSINKAIMSNTQFTDWENKLLGQKKAFSCTSVLSSDMIGYINTKLLGQKILSGWCPLAWK